ncbi:hypothetical protein CkaCkLH20_06331 [Colletotrichum karsti]|uniref:DUF6546 domain-containing protein n=1 Tax=Colletotrichum karsti TaxID=1095194 RepID=A0A9P6LK57_9PEZI|nr:uncharacterized protein CkaCkLH20_06331 [Colletotrichum karsti]KAF9876388.1 hypothetical protein CkaCkLH20_06331 [Colletotrichum karsti]
MQLRSRNIPSAGESPANTSSRSRWTSLPPEIRLMILEQLQRTKFPEQRTVSWCSVSSEWQAFFEKQNFRSLKLMTLADIQRFQRLVRDRQRLVKQVWLHIMLQRYGCGQCDIPEAARTITANNQTFSRRILALLTVLSQWDTTEREGTGLTLKLSAASPSDVEHRFSERGANGRNHQVRAQWLRFSKQGSKMRRIGSLLDFDTKAFTPKLRRQAQGGLPATPVVTEFVMSRTSHRSMSAAALEKVLPSFTRLEHIRYQPWRGVDLDDQMLRDLSNAALLQNLPSAISSLSLWEEASTRFHHRFRKLDEPTMDLVSAAVDASQRLRAFSASYAVDAVDFFRVAHGRTTTPYWPDLKTLAFTSMKALFDVRGSVLANDLLSAAGQAAMRMPQLGTLEIWSWRADDGFRFVYEVSERQTKLMIESSWNFRPSRDMLEVWRTVGATHTRHELEVTHVTLSKEQVARKYEFLPRLRLRNFIDGP